MNKTIDRIDAIEYYQSEAWKNIRMMCLQMSGFICQRCGNAGKQIGGIKILQIHHKTYERFGEEDLEDLECVCIQCHKKIHSNKLNMI